MFPRPPPRPHPSALRPAPPPSPAPLVDAVLLDYGGVVRREDPADFDDFARTVGIPPGRLWAAFHDIPEYALSRTGRLDAAGYRAGVLSALAAYLDPADAERTLAAWDELRRQDAPVLPEIATLLARLRPAVRLGLLSNAGGGAHARLDEAGVSALFDDVVTSGDVGLAKPDPRIFLLAARRLGIEPARCLFVDDTMRHVEGARDVGMRAHHHHRLRHRELLEVLSSLGLPVADLLADCLPAREST